MRIVVLIENTGPEGLVHEHGLSLWIEYKGHHILLDGGATGRALDNAAPLGVDLSQMDAVVLSHGHYDHADGLPALVAGRDAPIYLRTKAVEPHYHGDLPDRYIGVSEAVKETLKGRARSIEEKTAIFPGVWLVPDSVDHEQSLALEGQEGLVVCNSCCHAGAGYIVRDILEQFPGKKVVDLIGGLHLMGKDGVRSLGVAPGIVKNLGKWLFEELEVETLFTGHCTGIPGLALLKEDWPRRVAQLTTSMVINIPD